MQRKWAIIVAAVCGILAVFLTNAYFQEREARLRVKETRVLVAARPISRGTTIDYDMLAFKTMPVTFIEPGVLKSAESAVGKAAAVSIGAGEQILESKLIAPETGLTLAVKTPPRKRAFTISLEAAPAVGGMARPGDHVDVLAIFTAPQLTLTLFQNVLVLAVGQEMVPTEEERVRRRQRDEAAPRRGGTITFALTPQEVQILTVAMQHGKIQLTLRPRMERAEALPRVDLSNLPLAVDLNTLLQFYIRPSKIKPVPTVEIIRGLEKEITPIPMK